MPTIRMFFIQSTNCICGSVHPSSCWKHHSMTPPPPAAVRWGQARRLAFIDFRLQYEGRINRKDLIDFFGISVPQASTDLADYGVSAPHNMRYDPRVRTYLATPDFAPLYGRSTAVQYLFELAGIAREAISADESFIGYTPPTGVVSTPSRLIQAAEVARWVQSMRDRLAMRGTYQSMDEQGAREVVVSPHALGFDGLRWHVRAYCHSRTMFRDFAIGRFIVEGAVEPPTPIDPSMDLGWYTEVAISLVPHPGLSSAQRSVVMRDYGMVDGRHTLRCRKAMLFYTLRHLNLQDLTVSTQPAQQHVIVENASDVARWMDEDRRGA
ncbi:WYL domain-containing protein [Nocardiopsis yanglingensis]